jgi:small subunit ribosomal protein S16
MLKIRLQRTGRKHEPTFRVVLTKQQNSTKSGNVLEILGNYDPRRNEETQLKAERIQYWISQGAQPSDTLHNLLVKQSVIKGEIRNVLPKKSPIIKEPTEEEKAAEAKKAEEASAPVAEEVVETPAEDAPTESPAVEEAPKEETPVEEVKEEVVEEVAAETPVEEVPVEEEKKEA